MAIFSTATAAVADVSAVLLNIALGCALMIVTTVIHSACTVATLQVLKVTHAGRWGPATHLTRATLIASVVLMMFGAAMVESATWAATYVAVGAISGFEPALYFSTVTFTTLGYGDLVLPDGWRLLASFQAANGIIMFGWTTALIVAVAHYVHSEHVADDGS